jgi:hypothetical protein
MLKVNANTVNTINDAATLVGAFVPQAMVAYQLLKVIWLQTNPGKTEDDYLNMLQSVSQQNIDQSAAILIADGYSQDANGNWSKPGAPAALKSK